MGYELFREVLDHAPQDLTSGELVVLLVVADDANDHTRTGWISADDLQRRARMSARGVRAALQRLADRGIELRVARGVDSKGRPVYAHRGVQTTFVVPRFAPAEGGTVVPPSDEEGGTTVPPNKEEGGTTVPVFAEKGGTTVPQRRHYSAAKAEPECRPSPHAPHAPQQPRAREDVPETAGNEPTPLERMIIARTGATQNEAAAVAALIATERPHIRSPERVRFTDDELSGWLHRVRTDANRTNVRAWMTAAKRMPPCEHGLPGGDQTRPDTGKPLCPMCRRNLPGDHIRLVS